MSARAHLKSFWDQLNGINKALDDTEKVVHRELVPPTSEGRRTLFSATKRYTFRPNEFVSKTQTLVHSAGSVTRVVRLNYEVNIEFNTDTVRDLRRRFNLRVDPRVLEANPEGVGTEEYYLFDFEWNYSLGSTQKNYGQNRGNNAPTFLSRKSLGNPENNKQLLFSEKNPLVLNTNEALEITINPTFMFLNTTQNFFPASLDPVFVVSISYAAYRTFGYDS